MYIKLTNNIAMTTIKCRFSDKIIQMFFVVLYFDRIKKSC